MIQLSDRKSSTILKRFYQLTSVTILLLLPMFLWFAVKSYQLQRERLNVEKVNIFHEKTAELNLYLDEIERRSRSMKLLVENSLKLKYFPENLLIQSIIDDPKEKVFHLNNIPEPFTSEVAGNLFGVGSIKNRSLQDLLEIHSSINLNPFFQENFKSTAGIVHQYYKSKQGFINLFPWQHSNDIKNFHLHYFPERYSTKNAKNLFWTKIRQDHFKKGYIISCVTPVFREKQSIGFVGVDISIDYLFDLLDRFNELHGEVYIVHEKGDILASNKQKGINKIESIFNEFEDGLSVVIRGKLKEYQVGTVTLKSDDGQVLFEKLNGVPWFLIQRTHGAKDLSDYIDGVGIITLTIWFVLLSVIIYFFFFIREFYVNPAERFMKHIEMERKGGFSGKLEGLPEEWQTLFNKISQVFFVNREYQDKLNDYNKHLQSEVNEITASLQKKTKEAETANIMKSQFLATMSHEIRTPLHGIHGVLDLMKRTSLDSDQKEFMRIAEGASRSLMRIINEILDFTRIEDGKLSIERSEFSLLQVVEDVLDLMSVEADKKDIKLICEFCPALLTDVYSDQNRLRQVLTNLLSNAIKFSYNEKEVVLSVCKADWEDHLVFEVRDQGIGISQENVTKLFNVFTQVDSSVNRQHEGAGLGLAISKKLVELMGGKIWVTSEPGEGSIFSFSLEARIKPKAVHSNKAVKNKSVVLWGYKGKDLENMVGFFEYLEVNTILPDDFDAFKRYATDRSSLYFLMDSSALSGKQIETIKSIAENQAEKPKLFLLSVNQEMHRELLSKKSISPIVSISKPLKFSVIWDFLVDAYSAKSESVNMIDPFEKEMNQNNDLLELSILIAEDHIVNQKLLLYTLSMIGYEADVAEDGLEVLEKVRTKKYDIILMDIHMPDMDGLEASRQICKEFEEDERPAIIAVTANVLKTNKVECLEAGMDDFLGKPVEFEELKSILEIWGGMKTMGADENKERIKEDLELILKENLIDKSKIQKMSSMNFTTSSEVFDLFMDTSVSSISLIRGFLEEQKYNKLKKTAHKIKGASLNVGALRLAALSKLLEKTADSVKDDELLKTIIETMIVAYEETKNEISLIREVESKD